MGKQVKRGVEKSVENVDNSLFLPAQKILCKLIMNFVLKRVKNDVHIDKREENKRKEKKRNRSFLL